jgi:hypothetical protein
LQQLGPLAVPAVRGKGIGDQVAVYPAHINPTASASKMT